MTLNRSTFEFSGKLGHTYLKNIKKSLFSGDSKSTVINYVLAAAEGISRGKDNAVKIADFGSCEGDMLKSIDNLWNNKPDLDLTGFDYNPNLIKKSKEKYPDIDFHLADILHDPLDFDEQFDICLTTNTLHEVFTFGHKNSSLEESKQDVITAIANISTTLQPNGTLFIYDGIEHQNHYQEVEFKVKNKTTLDLLNKFIREYNGIEIEFEQVEEEIYKTNLRDLTRFITKLRFMDSVTWELEKEESYQYFTKAEYMKVLKQIGFSIESVVMLRPRLEEWRKDVEILTPSIDYPFEHILIAAKKEK